MMKTTKCGKLDSVLTEWLQENLVFHTPGESTILKQKVYDIGYDPIINDSKLLPTS
jgi:hypothetical protein